MMIVLRYRLFIATVVLVLQEGKKTITALTAPQWVKILVLNNSKKKEPKTTNIVPLVFVLKRLRFAFCLIQLPIYTAAIAVVAVVQPADPTSTFSQIHSRFVLTTSTLLFPACSCFVGFFYTQYVRLFCVLKPLSHFIKRVVVVRKILNQSKKTDKQS